MRKIIYIAVLLFFLVPDVQAQKKYVYQDSSLLETDEVVPVMDTAIRIVEAPVENVNSSDRYEELPEEIDTFLYKNNLHMPTDSVLYWKNLKEFGYTKYLDSLLKEKNKKQKPKTEHSTPRPPGFLNSIMGSSFLQVLLWILAIGFVLFIIYRLFLADGVFKRKTKAVKSEEAEVEEEIITPESDFDRLIRQALENNNYRQAVRYQYLRTLHVLAAAGFVQLAPDKTNYHYVTEISNRDHQNDFAALTLNYEYVWYGEFEIGLPVYQKIETGFINLNKKL